MRDIVSTELDRRMNERLKIQLREAWEVIGFYADRMNWNVSLGLPISRDSICQQVKFDDVSEVDELNRGGRRAREFLKTWGPKE